MDLCAWFFFVESYFGWGKEVVQVETHTVGFCFFFFFCVWEIWKKYVSLTKLKLRLSERKAQNVLKVRFFLNVKNGNEKLNLKNILYLAHLYVL